MSTKSKSQTKVTHGFRVIVRGTVGKGKAAHRVRHVHTIQAVDTGAAVAALEAKKDAIKGLSNVYVSVLPPLVAVKG